VFFFFLNLFNNLAKNANNTLETHFHHSYTLTHTKKGIDIILRITGEYYMQGKPKIHETAVTKKTNNSSPSSYNLETPTQPLNMTKSNFLLTTPLGNLTLLSISH